MKVLFVCRANAVRSQMGEAFYNSLSGTNDAKSAGVEPEHSIMKDDPRLPPLPLQAMNEVGIDLTEARRKKITEAMVDEADAVIVVLRDTEFPLPAYLEHSPKLVRWDDIPDPKGTDIETHRVVRDAVKKKVMDLLAMETAR